MPVNRQFVVDRDLVGARIKGLRKALGITQDDLAEALKIDQTTVSRWEDGKVPITIDDLGRVAHHLKKHVAWFVRPREPHEPLRESARLTDPNEDSATARRKKRG